MAFQHMFIKNSVENVGQSNSCWDEINDSQVLMEVHNDQSMKVCSGCVKEISMSKICHIRIPAQDIIIMKPQPSCHQDIPKFYVKQGDFLIPCKHSLVPTSYLRLNLPSRSCNHVQPSHVSTNNDIPLQMNLPCRSCSNVQPSQVSTSNPVSTNNHVSTRSHVSTSNNVPLNLPSSQVQPRNHVSRSSNVPWQLNLPSRSCSHVQARNHVSTSNNVQELDLFPEKLCCQSNTPREKGLKDFFPQETPRYDDDDQVLNTILRKSAEVLNESRHHANELRRKLKELTEDLHKLKTL